ncbi:MAG: 3-hydroxyacyl-CoA dehydrogenase [Burkholderiales bacterium]|nr:3-hydroxyacyl-CoA dehydrogenase [Burkholderiales bacterium]
MKPAPAAAGRPVAVIGAGSIGVAWAIVFARGGCSVRLQDPDADRLAAVPAEVAGRLRDLDGAGLLGEPPADIAARIAVARTLPAALADAVHVQENAPERLDVKRELFAAFAALAPGDATLASSSSAIVASAFAPDGVARERCLVAHPGNPPFLIPVVEIVPAPFTTRAAVDAVRGLMTGCGMQPVLVEREVEGFVFNRLQGAMLREAYCLVRDGVIGVEDLDTVVRDGLGLRWSVIGPFETSDLNTRGGIASHALKMGPAYARMGAERGQHDPWTEDLVARVAAERRAALPLARWDARVAWRDRALMRVVSARRTIPPFDPESTT